MHSCTCRPRQTLADRINAIISKYEKCPCPKTPQQTRKSCVPKILSTPCLRESTCNPCNSPCSPCPPRINCTAITSSCCPQETILTQPSPSPGPGLSRYISRRNLCPALRGCLSLYKRPSAVRGPATAQPSCCRAKCPPIPRCNPLISCPRSRPSCAVVRPNYGPLVNPKTQRPASSSLNGYCAKCKPREKCPQCSPCDQSISKSCCRCSDNSCTIREPISRQCSRPSCRPCNACCYSCNPETVRSQCTTTCCCYSCRRSSEFSSSTSGTCCISGSSCPPRRRLTVFDDPPYTSNILEREFSSRFIRLDNCSCETDSSSSLDNSNFGNKYR